MQFLSKDAIKLSGKRIWIEVGKHVITFKTNILEAIKYK